MRLLIVEEDAVVRRIFAWLAAMDGWEVYPYDQHIDICEVIRNKKIDVAMVSDPMFPGNDLELIVKIRAEGLNTPVIIVSASEYSVDKNQAEALGVSKILVKPPDVFELRTILKQAYQSI